MLNVKNVSTVANELEARGWIVNGHADSNGRTWDVSITAGSKTATLYIVTNGIIDVYVGADENGKTVKLENSDAKTVLDYILNKLIPAM